MKLTKDTRAYKILNQDFTQFIYSEGDHAFSRINKEKLMSFSSFTNYLTTINLMNIPETTLLNKKNFGANVMSHLQYLYENKVVDLNNYEFFSNSEQLAIETILQEVANEGGKIEFVEKLITNGRWYGYIDMIMTKKMFDRKKGYKIIELKTSSSDKLEFRHILQISIYWTILMDNHMFTDMNKAGYLIPEVWIYNTKTHTIKKYKINKRQMKQAIELVHFWLELFNLERYQFITWKGKKNDYKKQFKTIITK